MEPLSEDRAVEIAREAARDTYADVEAYDVSVDETEREWKIHFRLAGAQEDGGASHFAVWVDKVSGESRLFRGR